MTTATAMQERNLIDAIIREPLSLAIAHPHQIALSTGSIALMGSFAGSSGILDPYVGYCIAIGVEWAYLKGLASDTKAPTRWGAILNWSAFGIVVLWGVLWVASIIGAIDMHATGFWGFMLAAAHVVPIAWLSLCSAQTHRAAIIAERAVRTTQETERSAFEQEQEAERAQFELDQEAKDRDFNRWKEAYSLKQQLKSVTAASVTTPVTEVSQAVPMLSRDDQRAVVVTLYKTHGATLNVSQEARQLGISRALWYKLRGEAIERGEL